MPDRSRPATTPTADDPERTDASRAVARERSIALEDRIRAAPEQVRVLTGDRPTGPLHLGHLLGSLANRVRLQQLGAEVFVLVADYQVLTDRASGPGLAQTVRGQLADLLAVGIDPARSTIFCHSAVPELNELVLPLLGLVSVAELQRNPTVRAETALTGRSPSALMLTYPVHQAADILFCRADVVPVGIDQLPHLELTRTLVRRFAERYAPVFTLPEPLLSATPSVPGLDGQKMSKSRGNAIALRADEDETAAAIRRAPTDAERHVTYDPQRRPHVATLLELLAATTGEDPQLLAEQIGDGGAALLKAHLTDAVNALLAPIRHRRAALAADPGHLDAVLAAGNARAREEARRTLRDTHAALGMSYADRA